MYRRTRRSARLLLGLVFASSVAAFGQTSPPALHDVIAYVVGAGPDAGDEIRLIAPDGSGDRHLWTHGQPDPLGVYSVWNLAWNPQATRLTFASTHENWCSLFNSDVFTLGSDGSQYQRLTQSPACAELADYPKGTVRVPVRNDSFDSFYGYMYFQGASTILPVALAPGGTATIEFEDVADFGDGSDWLQFAAIMVGPYREMLHSTMVDVKGGGSVTTAQASISQPKTYLEAHSPTWRADGSGVMFQINASEFRDLPLGPRELHYGTPELAQNSSLPNYVWLPMRGPTTGTASRLLYAGATPLDATGIYLVTEGATGPGERLVTADSNEAVFGLAWLPDASGFVFAISEGGTFGSQVTANLFLYDFASQGLTRLTGYLGSVVGQVSVSGDGSRVVYELGAGLHLGTYELIDPSLYIIDIGDADLAGDLLVAGAKAPAWSW